MCALWFVFLTNVGSLFFVLINNDKLAAGLSSSGRCSGFDSQEYAPVSHTRSIIIKSNTAGWLFSTVINLTHAGKVGFIGKSVGILHCSWRYIDDTRCTHEVFAFHNLAGGCPLTTSLPTTSIMAHQTEVWTIWCVLEDEPSLFPIQVASNSPVGILKKEIKKDKKALANFDADHLRLYQVEFSQFPSMSRDARVTAIKDKLAENPPELPDLEELTDIFDGGPKKRMVHIIVQCPNSGK
jgi:Crinkler effector protein N-terminal domain